MTGRKFTHSKAAERLGISPEQLEREIASGALRVESVVGDHDVIPEQEIARYEREHPGGVSVRGGDPLPLEIEADYERRKDEP
jgi:hypothetical protein